VGKAGATSGLVGREVLEVEDKVCTVGFGFFLLFLSAHLYRKSGAQNNILSTGFRKSHIYIYDFRSK
jgi:hypothetical protein